LCGVSNPGRKIAFVAKPNYEHRRWGLVRDWGGHRSCGDLAVGPIQETLVSGPAKKGFLRSPCLRQLCCRFRRSTDLHNAFCWIGTDESVPVPRIPVGSRFSFGDGFRVWFVRKRFAKNRGHCLVRAAAGSIRGDLVDHAHVGLKTSTLARSASKSRAHSRELSLPNSYKKRNRNRSKFKLTHCPTDGSASVSE
jgi:hypothetical protein